MKNTRKGFTLVELLVVIAIIAILITVATMGYSSFIDKSNQSVDFQLVTQMNIALTASSVESRPVYPYEVRQILQGAGFDLTTQLDPTYEDYYFIWDKDNNVIVIVDESKGEIVFPEDFEGTAFTSDMLDGAHYFDIDMPAAIITVDGPKNNIPVFNSNELISLDATYTFKAEEIDSKYKDYYADYVVSFDNNVSDIGLFGYYEAFGEFSNGAWAGAVVPSVDAGIEVPLLKEANLGQWTYEDIQTIVQEFQCGVVDCATDDTNKGTTIIVKLCIWEGVDENGNYVGDPIVLNQVTYTFE